MSDVGELFVTVSCMDLCMHAHTISDSVSQKH